MNEKKSILNSNALYTLIAIVIGFVVGALFLLVAKINPIEAYTKLFTGVFSKPKFIVWSIIYASPLIFTGLSVAFSFKTGVFNIGAEGQFVVGTLAAAVVGIMVDVPAVIHVPLCILAAAAAGSIWGSLVGFLKVKKGINEVLLFIMFNWIAFYLSNYVVNLEAIHKEGGGEATKDVLESARILMPQSIRQLTGCSNVNYGIILAIIAAVVIWFLINKTTLGYQLRAVGFNRNAAEYGGINANRAVMTAMAISGGLAGLGGAVQLLGMSMRVSQFATQESYGFQGITVALIAGSNPIGCIFSGLFYGAMKYGGSKLSLINAPSEVVDIIMGTIILFIAVSHVFKKLALKGKGGKMMDTIIKDLGLLINATLVATPPLLYAALGSCFSERSGVVNIGIEGMMTIGAFTGAAVALFTGNGWFAFFCGGLAGALFGLIHAIACVTFGADQTISGTAINFLAPGLAVFLCKAMFDNSTDTPPIDTASKLPKLLDGVFPVGSFANNVFSTYVPAYLCFVLVLVVWFVFYKTRFGLRLRAVGEHPQACDTLGINVFRVRYICVILSGFLAGLGGAYVTLATINQFRPIVIVGQGFIAIAAVIFGKFTPQGAMKACLLFGLCSGLKVMAGSGNTISPNLISMIPYVVTIITLVLFVGRGRVPAANGKPYVKSK